MKNILISAFAFAAGLSLAAPALAQMDQATMMKWMDATIVHYEVVGEFKDRVLIVHSGGGGYAQIADSMTLSFDFDITESKLASMPTFTNKATTMGALEPGEPGCNPPVLAGKYEHRTIEEVTEGFGGMLTLKVRTEFPGALSPQVCTDAGIREQARSDYDEVQFVVPGIMTFAMDPASLGDKMILSKDRGSMTVKGLDGWSYVVTPSKVR